MRRIPVAGVPNLVARLVVVALGLLVFAVGIVLTLVSGLGLGPWLVLSDGLTRVAPLSFGLATAVVGVVVVGVAWLLRIRPALGTLLNMTLVGAYADLLLATGYLPDLRGAGWSAPEIGARLALLLGGIVLVGLGTAFYLKGGLGAGPRDGLMLGLSRRLGQPVALVRTAIEVTVLVLGVLLGGTAGLGTLLYALGIGPAVAIWFRLLGVTVAPAPAVEAGPGGRE